MKRIIAIILSTTLLVGLLASCNKATPTTNTSASVSASESAEPVSISLWIYPQYETFEAMVKEKFIPAVTAADPNITLNTELLSFDAGPEKLTVAMATGATPDFILDGLSRLAPAIEAGLCADVSDLMSDLSGIILEGYQKIGVLDGKNFYIPMSSSNAYDFCVNTTLAKELGVYDLLPADKIHWSYDQFLAFCRAARAAGKSKGIYATQLWAGTRSSDASYYSFLMSGGTDITNSDNTKVTFNTPQAEASLAVLKTLIDEKLVPEGAATTKDTDIDANFLSGKLVIRFQSAGAQTNVQVFNLAKAGEITGFDTESIQMPSPTGKTEPKVGSWGTSGFVIFNNANDLAKITAAKKAIEVWFNNPEIGVDYCLNSAAAPTANNVTLDYKDATLNEQVKAAIEANAKYSTSEFGILKPWWSDFRETFYIQLQAYYTGTKTAKQALTDWETNGNLVITKALAKS